MFPSGPKRPCWLETRDLRKLCHVSARAHLNKYNFHIGETTFAKLYYAAKDRLASKHTTAWKPSKLKS